jgi:hypothetical protein
MNPFIDGTPKKPIPQPDAMEEEFQGSGASADDVQDNRVRKDEKKIDRSLKDTFPASDPPSAMPGAD